MTSSSPTKEPFINQHNSNDEQTTTHTVLSDVSCGNDIRQIIDKDHVVDRPNFLNCQEKMPLLNEKLDESSNSLHVIDSCANCATAHNVITVPEQKIILPKMLTEPSNLHGLSLKSAPRTQKTLAKGDSTHFKILCPKVTTVFPARDRIINNGNINGEFAENFNGPACKMMDPQCKWSSSYALHKALKLGSQKSDFQYPRCLRHKSTHEIAGVKPSSEGGGLGARCDCRLCRIQDLWPLPHPHNVTKTPHALDVGQNNVLEPQELGSMCQWCGQTFGDPQLVGECPWSRSGAGFLPHTCHLNPTISAGALIPNFALVVPSDSCHTCLITSREQGVQVSNWSLSSVSTCSGPMCRICHSPGDKTEPLMSPCRCSGTLKYVHSSCLLRWLEISRRKLHRAPHCELCGYKYQRHKIMRIRKLQCPTCTKRDKMLHITFLAAILIMILCAGTTVFCFKAERQQKSVTSTDKIELSSQEVLTLVCGVTFFCAFFLSMYVQVKAQTTIYKLLMRFWIMNQEWRIEEYRPDRDPQIGGSKKSRIRPVPPSAAPRSTSV